MFIHQDFQSNRTFFYVKSLSDPMEPQTLEQEAIIRLLGSSRSQAEWDSRVEKLLTIHFQGKIPPFWIDLVIKSNLYFRTRQKWIHRRLNSVKINL
jgi:hypothetical protein